MIICSIVKHHNKKGSSEVGQEVVHEQGKVVAQAPEDCEGIDYLSDCGTGYEKFPRTKTTGWVLLSVSLE